ncbi:MAG TPA: alpha/beta fold hydrolase, partial [Planctomycetaceae bacterium]|nr:alpha/beta fold hydrolase [Planctomycetaceae bacterium]
NRRNGRDTDLYLADTRVPGWAKLILETDGEYWQAGDLSRDGTRLLINHYVSINETYPAVLDFNAGRLTRIPIPNTDGPVAYGPLKFSRDGRYAFAASDAAGEFRQLAAIDLDSMKYIWLTPHIPWDVEAIEISPANDRVAFAVNENGASRLYWFEARPIEIDGQKELAISPASEIDLPLGVVSGLEFTRDGRRLGFTLARADSPAEAYSYDFDGRRVVRWTYSEVGGLDASLFVSPEQIAYSTFDTVGPGNQPRVIPAYLFKPRTASAQSPAPVLINIHGGPESQYRPTLSSFDQFLLSEMGIAVIRPNVRGSEGYGKTYLRLDNAERREDSVRDIGALIDWIGTQPDLDAERVGVIGGSYGGYMVLASLVHFSDRLKAGVDIVGIASFQTFLENTSAYRQDLRRAEYGDEREPRMQQFFQRIDPLHNAGKITAALFVAHGRNDPRVPFSEAEQIADKVRTNGQPVWTVYADNEGHGFAKKANRDYLYAAIALFLQDRLVEGDSGAKSPSR